MKQLLNCDVRWLIIFALLMLNDFLWHRLLYDGRTVSWLICFSVSVPYLILFFSWRTVSPTQMFAQTLLILQGPVRLFPLRSFP